MDSLPQVIEDCKLGKNVKIFGAVNIFGCEIGDNTKIGCFVEIKRGAKIGANCKIEPFAFIPDGTIIEDNCFIGPHVCFTNDNKPRATGKDGKPVPAGNWVVSPATVKKGASIGANATILPGITIGENAVVGAGSVVTKDVEPGAMVVGNPARKIRMAEF